MTDLEYDTRYDAINDALWLVQRGPRDPRPPVEDTSPNRAARGGFEMPMYTSYSREAGPSEDPRYAEINLALDIARFLLNEETGADGASDD